jgi:hypothetical protein
MKKLAKKMTSLKGHCKSTRNYRGREHAKNPAQKSPKKYTTEDPGDQNPSNQQDKTTK